MEKIVKILLVESVTHDVKRFILEKPTGYKFIPGQATEVAINKRGFKNKKRPFTFTSLNKDLVLEFLIKGYPTDKYPAHKGVTGELHKLKPGDELIIGKPWGTINCQGPGVFIAAGAGMTPFIAIFRQLKNQGKLKGNTFIFSNKTQRDIILENELKALFDNPRDLILTLTREKREGYEKGRINFDFLKRKIDNFSQHFYICGPRSMVKDLRDNLSKLGTKAEFLVFEK